MGRRELKTMVAFCDVCDRTLSVAPESCTGCGKDYCAPCASRSLTVSTANWHGDQSRGGPYVCLCDACSAIPPSHVRDIVAAFAVLAECDDHAKYILEKNQKKRSLIVSEIGKLYERLLLHRSTASDMEVQE